MVSLSAPLLSPLRAGSLTVRATLTLLPRQGSGPATGKGHDPFFHSHDPGGQLFHLPQVEKDEGGEEGVSPSSKPLYRRCEVGLALLCSLPQLQPCNPHVQSQQYTMLPRQGAGPTGEGQDHLSCSHDPIRASSPARRDRGSLPSLCQHTTDKRRGQFSHTHTLRSGSPTTPTSRASFTVLPRSGSRYLHSQVLQ